MPGSALATGACRVYSQIDLPRRRFLGMRETCLAANSILSFWGVANGAHRESHRNTRFFVLSARSA